MQTERGGSQMGAVTEVVLLFVIGLLLLVVLGELVRPLLSVLGLRSLLAGRFAVIPQVVLPEVLGLGLPAVLFQKWRAARPLPPDPSWLFPIRWRFLRLLVAGVLLGAALFYFLGVWILPLYERVVPLSPAEQRLLLRMLVPPTGLRPLWVDLATFAFCPAICEELFFRGAILEHLQVSHAEPRADVDSLGAHPLVTPVLLSALLFGIIHLSWGRLLPTALLGAAFAVAVLRSGSLWTSIAMHTTNNAAVVILARRGVVSLASVSLAYKWMLLVPACLALGLGVWLLKPALAGISARRDA